MNRFEQQVKFEEAWVHELCWAHEDICWRYGVNLRTPMIEITSAVKKWGEWDPGIRTIKISGNLIREHSWDVTLNVFKHEMAHQIVTDRFGMVEAPHGPFFQQACTMIGVPGPFRNGSGDTSAIIEEIKSDRISRENSRVLEKVRKLLSLAGSPNENEALLAMQKANELIEKHNIERIEQNREAGFVYAIINHKKKRIENYQRRIGLILQEHFFVNVVYSYLYDPVTAETHRTIELLGAAENVRIAEYVYHFLMNQMELLWKSYQRKRKTMPKNKRSYRLGVLNGFNEKLNEQAALRSNRYRSEPGGPDSLRALILAEDRALEEFVHMRFPRLYSSRHTGTKIDRLAFQAGMVDGKSLNLHKGIHHHDGNQGKQLGGPPAKKSF